MWELGIGLKVGVLGTFFNVVAIPLSHWSQVAPLVGSLFCRLWPSVPHRCSPVLQDLCTCWAVPASKCAYTIWAGGSHRRKAMGVKEEGPTVETRDSERNESEESTWVVAQKIQPFLLTTCLCCCHCSFARVVIGTSTIHITPLLLLVSLASHLTTLVQSAFITATSPRKHILRTLSPYQF